MYSRLLAIVAAAMMAAACAMTLPSADELVFACHSSEDCSAGYFCDPDNKICVAEGTDAGLRDRRVASDAGSDSAVIDVLEFDASDAGSADIQAPDATTFDAGLIDTSVADLFNPDTSASDVSVADSLIPDASQPDNQVDSDAAQPDAFVPDTGAPDAFVPDTSAPDTSEPDSFVEDAWTCEPTGPEIVYLGEDNCADGQDNDCDGLTDDESWECQDRDGDGIPNAVDVINVLDLDQTPGAETLCVPAHLVLASPWREQAAYRQGTPDLYWSGLDTLDGAALDPLTPIPGAGQYHEWCHDFSGEIASNYIYRYVGQLGANGQDPVNQTNCNDWVRSEINSFCNYYSDAYCRRLFSNDGCQSINEIIGVNWATSGLSPM